jgi:glucosamine-6-phosphate deaminase
MIMELSRQFQRGPLEVCVYETKDAPGMDAARTAGVYIQQAIRKRGRARLLFSVANSQREMVENLMATAARQGAIKRNQGNESTKQERDSKVQIKVLKDKNSLGRAAAEQAASSLHNAIRELGRARIVVATGASQFEFLDALTGMSDVDWSRVEMFHLDEYVGLPVTHPASFRKYLLERLINKTGIRRYRLLDPGGDPEEVARRVGLELNTEPVDIAFVGIGENGHLAFNDPPADFEAQDPYLVVSLNDACRQQQVNEGWFTTVSEVPRQAISMSVHQILRAKEIIAAVPDERKAQAIKSCFEGPITPLAPASILRTHPNVTIFLDRNSAALLNPEMTRVR